MHGIDFTMEEERRYISCGNPERLDRFVRSEIFRGIASVGVFLFLSFRFVLPLWVAPAMIGYSVVLYLALRSICKLEDVYCGILGKLYMALFERLNDESYAKKLTELNANDNAKRTRLIAFPAILFFAVLMLYACTLEKFSMAVGIASSVLILLFCYLKVSAVLRVKRICAVICQNGKTFVNLQGKR